jgi:hypothetical protein
MDWRDASVMRNAFAAGKRVTMPNARAVARFRLGRAIVRLRWQHGTERTHGEPLEILFSAADMRREQGLRFFEKSSMEASPKSIRVGRWTDWAFEVSVKDRKVG